MTESLNDLLVRLEACEDAREWAETQPDLATAWKNCRRADWMLWLLDELGHEDPKNYHLIACACVRETPLADGRRVWDLLTDPRSRNAVEVAERFAVGEATEEDRAAARDAAWDAARDAAWAAAWDAAWAAAWAAARAAAGAAAGDAARDAAWDAARAAAGAAAGDAARDAAWDAARDAAWAAAGAAARAAAGDAARDAAWAAARAAARAAAGAAARAAQSDIIRRYLPECPVGGAE